MGNCLEGYVRKTRIIKLGGKDFKFSELSLGDLARFRARIVEQREATRQERKSKLIKDAKDIEGITPEMILDLLEKPISDEEIEAEMETIDGLGFLAYLSLKYALPEITLEEVLQMVTLETIEPISEILISGDKKKLPTKRARQPIKKKP